MKNPNTVIVSFNLSKQSIEKLGKIAYLLSISKSAALDNLLTNLSEFTLKKHGKKKGLDHGND